MFLFAFLLFLCYACFIILASYGFWKQKKKLLSTPLHAAKTPISIIIPARNEAANILSCLESIAQNQKHNIPFEVLVMDDFSEDDTAQIAQDFFKIHPIGRVLKLEDVLKGSRINAYKKKAIEIGIQASQYEWIVQTDADCIVPTDWLYNMQVYMAQADLQFIAAPVAMMPLKGGIFSKLLYVFQSVDFMTMQGITAATHHYKIGLMCNGANLAYRKSAFQAVSGFKDIDGIASGDDMLLLHKINHQFPYSSFYLASPESIVNTASQPTFKDFLQQRIRWSSKATHYKDKRLTWILGLVFLFNLQLLLQLILSIFYSDLINLTLYLFIGKIAMEYLLLIPVSKFFNKQKQLFIFPFLQIFHVVYIVSTALLGTVGKYQWKNRTVK